MSKDLIHTHHHNPFKSWHVFLLIIPSIIFVLTVVFFSRNANVKNNAAFSAVPTPKTKLAIEIKGTTILAEVAQTDEDRRVGLSKHNSLPDRGGMLFVFENNATPSFWMKDMSFPIDIIWINDGEVVQIDSDVAPEPGTPSNQLTLYVPNQPIDYVLEVNSGLANALGISRGDSVNFDLFN